MYNLSRKEINRIDNFIYPICENIISPFVTCVRLGIIRKPSKNFNIKFSYNITDEEIIRVKNKIIYVSLISNADEKTITDIINYIKTENNDIKIQEIIFIIWVDDNKTKIKVDKSKFDFPITIFRVIGNIEYKEKYSIVSLKCIDKKLQIKKAIELFPRFSSVYEINDVKLEDVITQVKEKTSVKCTLYNNAFNLGYNEIWEDIIKSKVDSIKETYK